MYFFICKQYLLISYLKVLLPEIIWLADRLMCSAVCLYHMLSVDIGGGVQPPLSMTARLQSSVGKSNLFKAILNWCHYQILKSTHHYYVSTDPVFRL